VLRGTCWHGFETVRQLDTQTGVAPLPA
jgi:hypothetical protein